MKKRTLYSIILAVGMGFSSCSDQFLEDMSPYDKYAPEKVFGVEANLDTYIQNVYYNYFYKSGMTPAQSYGLCGSWNDYSVYTEEKWGIDKKFDPTKELYKATDCESYFGKNLAVNISNDPYSRIRSCNEVLEGVDKYGQTLSEDAKKRARGQVYFLRGMQLFDLVRVYGAVPVVNIVMNAADRDEARKYKRESVETCMAQILDDLQNAAEMLPSRNEWGNSQYGRLTREAALAYKSRVALVFASPIFNADWDNTSNARWQDALKIAQEARTELDKLGYGLYGNSAKDWNEMFYKFDNTPCKEVIMVKLLSSTTSKNDEHSNWHRTIRLKTMGGSGAGYQVPMGMLDVFPMSDGKPAVDNEGKAINNYDKTLFFKNRDPRFYYTFAFSGVQWGYDEDDEAVVWNYRWSETKDDQSQNHYYTENGGSSPAIVRKMSDPDEISENTYQWDGTDVFEYRYAELLLNLAECYAATGQPAEAVKVIGEIRARVGIPATDNYGLGNITDKNEAIKACLRERQVELAYEGKRYWDLWRWMLYNDEAGDNNTTCAVLGLNPLNGTSRVGKYLQVKSYDGKEDPMRDVIANFEPVDVDNAADLQAEMARLGEFWKAHFEFVETETPVDAVNNQPVVITWKENYYLSGLPANVLNMNPWLEQSKGWLDYYQSEGTLDARK